MTIFELSSTLSSGDARELYESFLYSLEKRYGSQNIDRGLGRNIGEIELNDKATSHETVRMMPSETSETNHGEWHRFGNGQLRIDAVWGDDGIMLRRKSCVLHAPKGQKRSSESFVRAAKEDGVPLILISNPAYELDDRAKCQCQEPRI